MANQTSHWFHVNRCAREKEKDLLATQANQTFREPGSEANRTSPSGSENSTIRHIARCYSFSSNVVMMPSSFFMTPASSRRTSSAGLASRRIVDVTSTMRVTA